MVLAKGVVGGWGREVRKMSCLVSSVSVSQGDKCSGDWLYDMNILTLLKLIEFCQENALVIANTLFPQHKRRLYTWTSPDGQHRNQIDYMLCNQR